MGKDKSQPAPPPRERSKSRDEPGPGEEADEGGMLLQLHTPMKEWYAADEQSAIRAKYGQFPILPASMQAWPPVKEVVKAFIGGEGAAAAPSPPEDDDKKEKG